MKRIGFILFLVLFLSGCTLLLGEDVDVTLNPGYDIIGIDEEWVDAGCQITIDDVTYDMATTMTVDSSTLGSTTIIYSYEGTLDTYYCQRVVQVIDTVPPVVTLLPGVDTIFVDDEHIDAGIVSSDEYSEELTTVIVTNVDVTEAGTYSIIYTVTDEEGNRTVATRVVTVIDLD